MSSRSSRKYRKESKGSSGSSSAVASWSDWKWNDEREQWQSHRKNARGQIEWQFRSDQSTSGESSGSIVPRFDDTVPLETVTEYTAQYSTNNNYTTGNNNVQAPANVLETTNLDSQANLDPPIAAKLEQNNTSIEHKNFDPNYKIHDGWEFKFGKVFKVLWSEPTGSARGGTIKSVREKHGEEIHAKVRRFVIVDRRRGHCLCLPIMSYEGRATTKPGVHAEDHAIIHTTSNARLVPNENGNQMIFRPVKVIPESKRHWLDPASRINYAKVYTVEYNVKVWFIGHVDRDSESTVKESYDQAHPPLNLSSQTSALRSYQMDNSAYRVPSYTTPGATSNYTNISSYGNNVSRSTPAYDTRYSSTSDAHEAYGSARQNSSTQNTPSSYNSSQYPVTAYPCSQSTQSQYPPSQYPPSQYPPTRYSTSQYSPSQYIPSQYPTYAPNTNSQYSYNPESKYGSSSSGGQ
ncbi:hypothetical protein EYC80_003399 [Monilinia laxa]|uniref:DUF6590 domain-containing protein n=1 Tax=Monilinia laxa TaxID=61186 RepID=A0A5N6KDY7_MONLA|nr:hypothetical protein EYC80_003399 [Monilinia laxa]